MSLKNYALGFILVVSHILAKEHYILVENHRLVMVRKHHILSKEDILMVNCNHLVLKNMDSLQLEEAFKVTQTKNIHQFIIVNTLAEEDKEKNHLVEHLEFKNEQVQSANPLYVSFMSHNLEQIRNVYYNKNM